MNLILKLINAPISIGTRFYNLFNPLLFKAKGVKFGNNFKVLGKVNIIGKGKISIGNNFFMTSGLNLNPISANIEGFFFTDSASAEIHIGNNVGMSGTRMWIHKKLTIGNNVKIGGGVLIIDSDCHPVDYKTRRTSNDGTKSEPIFIEDDVWIGAHCNILKGVTIGSRSIIGAGSIVTKSIPADCIAAGNPCKIIRHLDNKQKGEYNRTCKN